MKIKRSSNGAISMTAQSEEDSIELLELVENMAGRGNDPERASVKKRAELELRREAYKSALFINHGSVEDIRSTIACAGVYKYSVEELQQEIEREKITRNRSTVIKMIERLIAKKEKGVAHGSQKI